MKLIPYDKSILKRGWYARTKNQVYIQEFIDSEYDCVKLENYTHNDAKSCQNAMQCTIKRMGVFNRIRCAIRNGEVFLVKLDI